MHVRERHATTTSSGQISRGTRPNLVESEKVVFIVPTTILYLAIPRALCSKAENPIDPSIVTRPNLVGFRDDDPPRGGTAARQHGNTATRLHGNTATRQHAQPRTTELMKWAAASLFVKSQKNWSPGPCPRKRAVKHFGWGFFLISFGSPHVRPMERTCGEPDDIELTPIGGEIERRSRHTISSW